jgi:hypothetical protein
MGEEGRSTRNGKDSRENLKVDRVCRELRESGI